MDTHTPRARTHAFNRKALFRFIQLDVKTQRMWALKLFIDLSLRHSRSSVTQCCRLNTGNRSCNGFSVWGSSVAEGKLWYFIHHIGEIRSSPWGRWCCENPLLSYKFMYIYMYSCIIHELRNTPKINKDTKFPHTIKAQLNMLASSLMGLRA